MQPIAVAIVHGIEIEDDNFADTPRKLLLDGFADAVGAPVPDPEQALVIKGIHWAPDAEPRQRALFERVFQAETDEYFEATITKTIKSLNAGRTRSLVPLMASAANRTVGDLDQLHWPAARWLLMHFVGDAIAYDRCGGAANYHAAHAAFAEGLASLAAEAGPTAPLCVIAHSFGTVLASDYFYDQQQPPGRKLTAPEVRHARGSSPLARGHTLAWLYTLGSPLALWSLRYSNAALDQPIAFPGAKVAEHYPDLEPEWINFYDKDDIVAYPLRVLSDEYRETVTEDREVRVRELPLSMTPLAHPFYWSDRVVMDPIAGALAAAWEQINL